MQKNQIEFLEEYKNLSKKYNCMIQFNVHANRFTLTKYNEIELKMIEEEIYDKS